MTNFYIFSDEKTSKRPPALNISKASKIDAMMQEEPETPQTPMLHHNIVDHIVKQAYGLHNYHPEDTEHNHDDGSNLCQPTSKLTTRKISVGRKISSESMPSSLDGDFGGKSNELRSPDLVRQGIDSPRTPPKSPMMNPKFNTATMNDFIEEIYSKNSEIMLEFQSYLEASIEKEPVINVDEEKKFLEKKGIVDNEFVCTPEPPKMDDEDNEDAQSFSDSFESTDTEQETVTEMSKIPGKFKKYSGRRRESIEDCNGWFTNHLDLEEKKSQLTSSRDPLPASSTYDTQKIFPFGPTITNRRESLSDEFFADIQTIQSKPLVPPVSECDSYSEDEKDENSKTDMRERSPDHSTLLKYFDKEAKEKL
jgi:hypothetical protein